MKNDLMHGQKGHKKAAERKEELCHFFSFAKADCWEYSQKQHNSQTLQEVEEEPIPFYILGYSRHSSSGTAT